MGFAGAQKKKCETLFGKTIHRKKYQKKKTQGTQNREIEKHEEESQKAQQGKKIRSYYMLM